MSNKRTTVTITKSSAFTLTLLILLVEWLYVTLYLFGATNPQIFGELDELHQPRLQQPGKQNLHRLSEKKKNNAKPTISKVHEHKTGSFANCIEQIKVPSLTTTSSHHHADQKEITVSCHTFNYRMPSIHQQPIESIIVGVLSAPGPDGFKRRSAIRNTWARGHSSSVLFIVAGPWEDIEDEYAIHGDLLWLDMEEAYSGENSILTYKTHTFIKVVSTAEYADDIKYAFKTDDDSFVNILRLRQHLEAPPPGMLDYWGHCQLQENYEFKPRRDKGYKWGVSEQLYPEEYYPPYCQGAGYALSKTFLDCAASHVGTLRFMPFEDVSVGLLAERCGIVPSTTGPQIVRLYRTDSEVEKEAIKNNKPRTYMQGFMDGFKDFAKKNEEPEDVTSIVVQHRIWDEEDMMDFYKQTTQTTSISYRGFVRQRLKDGGAPTKEEAMEYIRASMKRKEIEQ